MYAWTHIHTHTQMTTPNKQGLRFIHYYSPSDQTVPGTIKYLFSWMKLNFCMVDSVCFLIPSSDQMFSPQKTSPRWLLNKVGLSQPILRATSLLPCFIIFLSLLSISEIVYAYLHVRMYMFTVYFPILLLKDNRAEQCFSVLFTLVSSVLRIAFGM